MNGTCNICSIASGNIERLVDAISDLFTYNKNGHGSRQQQRRRNTSKGVSPNREHQPESLDGKRCKRENTERKSEESITNAVSKDAPDNNYISKNATNIDAEEDPSKHNRPTESQSVTLLVPEGNDDFFNPQFHNNDNEVDTHSLHSIPSLFSVNSDVDIDMQYNDAMNGNNSSATFNDSIHDIATKQKDSTNSVMAWGVLVAVLGSPAPTSVSKKDTSTRNKKKEIVNLWEEDTSSLSIGSVKGTSELGLCSSDESIPLILPSQIHVNGAQ